MSRTTSTTTVRLHELWSAAILVLLGIMIGVLVVTGQLNNYLRPAFSPLLAVTGVVLLGLGIWSAVATIRQPGPWHLGQGHPDQRHSPIRRTSWMLLVPVLLVVLVAPDPLGSALLTSQAAGGSEETSTTTTRRPRARIQSPSARPRNPGGTVVYPPLSQTGINEMTLEELVLRHTEGDPAALEGRTVSVIGFASLDPKTGWRLGRFRIVCCAADAIGYRAQLRGTSDLVDDQWYQVTGVVDTTGALPAIQVTSLNAIDQPVTPYL
ncbi:TIGR03943 family protein [Propionibacterium sp. oral taxon 192 str. F0372]|uniref:TIGR03943 family putative permease subunit n=1 Tax=Propionibacterium sp. oral taxon 192 TaxID=671222 RepID=UPI000354369B|nr:TIGR03943 family protein [Propionibacterium sp. oral taxon 192]EPH07164.1 TIGR03943 family protein [Propionibacterium sp. oral taxon 192 str. F0372]